MLGKNQTYEKFTKNVRKSYENMYDSLLANTQNMKELRKNYDVYNFLFVYNERLT